MSNWFYDAILARLRSGQNWTCLVSGETGSGKSYASMKLAFDLDLTKDGEHRFPLDASRIIFNPQDFLDFLSGEKENDLPPGSFLIMDEAALSLNAQRWFDVQSQAMSGVTQSFRCRQLATLFTFPGSLGFINKQIRSTAHTALVMRTVNKNAGWSVGTFKILQTNIFSGVTYKHQPELDTPDGVVGLEQFKFFLPPKKLIEAYEKRKDIFLRGYYKELAEKMRMRSEGIYAKRVDMAAFYKKALENPILFIDAKKKRFKSALLRVRLGLTANNASQLCMALNADLQAGRIKIQ
jgi:hypothetical protein